MGDAYTFAWDIETTGGDPTRDLTFAVGAALLEGARVVSKQRWVLRFGGGARTEAEWRRVWADGGYEVRCFDEFWARHLAVLNAMMARTDGSVWDDAAAMVRDMAAYRTRVFQLHPGVVTVYDTVGFDVTNLDLLAARHGHTPFFLDPVTRWPAAVAYLGDVRRLALGLSLWHRAYSDDERRAAAEHDRRALPAGLQHTHDPADDALCIAHKWRYYSELAMRRCGY